MKECLLECQNETWGGEGYCIRDGSGEEYCQCDEGFYNTNSIDRADCQPIHATHVAYWIVIFFAVAAAAHAVFHVYRQRSLLHLSGVVYNMWTNQDKLRRRLYCSGIAWGVCTAFLYILLLAELLTFTQILPGMAVMFCIMSDLILTSCELWVSLLPKSLLKAGTIGYWICNALQHSKHIKIAIPFDICYVLGAAVGFFGFPVVARYILQGVCAVQLLYSVIVIDIVCASLLTVISEAKFRGSGAKNNKHVVHSYDEINQSLKRMSIGANCLLANISMMIAISLGTSFGIQTPLIFYVTLMGLGPSLWSIYTIQILCVNAKSVKLGMTAKLKAPGLLAATGRLDKKYPQIGSQLGSPRTPIKSDISSINSSLGSTLGSPLTAKGSVIPPNGSVIPPNSSSAGSLQPLKLPPSLAKNVMLVVPFEDGSV